MKKKQLPALMLIIIHLLCIGTGLIIFALFHHVINFDEPVLPVVLVSPHPAVSVAEEPVISSSSDPDEEANFTKVKFADKFSHEGIIQTETSYQSENIAVFIEHVSENDVTYNLADIYLSDISYLKTAFGGGEYRETTESAIDLARSNNAVIAISGDHFGARKEGIVVRNGILYRDTMFEDLCIIDTDGFMTTLEAPIDDSTAEALLNSNVWQVWSFGPALLDSSGNAKTVFNSSVNPRNPRTAIGYYEPGHYCFLEVDGRIKDSVGMSMSELSEFFHSLGCSAAYNLDGGDTSNFIWNGQRLSYPYGRDCWDIIYIGE